MIVNFIDENKNQYGALAICRVLPIAPSTFYSVKDLESLPEKHSLHSQHDEFYLSEIRRIQQDSRYRYGARKVWQHIKANGAHVAQSAVERLMKQYQLQGVWRGKGKIITHSRDDQKRAYDLVNRNFSPHRPNQL